MKDEIKTKKQLIEELAELRQGLSEQHEINQKQKQISEELKIIEDAMGDILIVLDMKRGVKRLSKAALDLLGYEPEEVAVLTSEKLFPERERGKHYTEMKYAIETGSVSSFETLLLTKGGREVQVILSGAVMNNLKGEPVGLVNVCRDITGDKLTTAYNKTHYKEVMAVELERARRLNHHLSMLIFHIDKLKEIHDTFGRSVGDHVLKSLSDVIRKENRTIDFLTKRGGEDFMIIAPGTDLEGAKVLAERVKKAIEGYSFDIVGRLTVSVGVTQLRRDDTEDTVLIRTDTALYNAKKSDGNRVEASV
ncbi:MAG: diguanylate cyclase [Deltaproteobacteria bacterium]|nr:diguanylate cyclase [Deltaproteobacteria bacterium]